MRSLAGLVVVITGASSGIGRAAAHAFAREGCRLVLVARRKHALEDAAEECRRLGAQGVAIFPADVSDLPSVESVGAGTLAAYGRLDVWINNAGVLALGRFEDVPAEIFRGVIDVNLHGYANGARVALRQFRRQRQGTLVNNASILSFSGWPYAAAYVASKYAIRGLSECLREELRGAPRIHVCTLMPAAMDTPIFARSANYTPWQPRAVPPVYDATSVADAMVRLARDPKRELIVGAFGCLVAAGKALAPAVMEQVIRTAGPALQFRQRGAPAVSREGNVLRPIEDGLAVTGGWRSPSARWIRGAALALALLSLAAIVRRAAGGSGGGHRR
jgi:short-subunit dehydrogenase